MGDRLTFCALLLVVKVRLVLLPSCDVYKELIYVYDFVLKLQLFVQKTDHDVSI